MLWGRFGDGGNYQEVGGLTELVDELRNLGIKKIWPVNQYGVAADGYTAHNYISLYFGPDFETPTRGLTDEELNYVNNLL